MTRILRYMNFGEASTITKIGRGARDEHFLFIVRQSAFVDGEFRVAKGSVASFGVAGNDDSAADASCRSGSSSSSSSSSSIGCGGR